MEISARAPRRGRAGRHAHLDHLAVLGQRVVPRVRRRRRRRLERDAAAALARRHAAPDVVARQRRVRAQQLARGALLLVVEGALAEAAPLQLRADRRERLVAQLRPDARRREALAHDVQRHVVDHVHRQRRAEHLVPVPQQALRVLGRQRLAAPAQLEGPPARPVQRRQVARGRRVRRRRHRGGLRGARALGEHGVQGVRLRLSRALREHGF